MVGRRFLLPALAIYGAVPLHAQWAKTNGPDSVRAMAYNHVVDIDVSWSSLYAARKNGVFRSGAGGTNWGIYNSGLTDTNMAALAVDRHGVVFAGSVNGGVFRLIEAGISNPSWFGGGDLAGTVISALALGKFIFAGTNFGVYQTSNVGWVPLNSGLTNLAVLSLIAFDSSLFAGTSGGVFRSTNNGVSWSALNAGLTNLNVRALARGSVVLTGGVATTTVFAGTDSGTFRLDGASWSADNGSYGKKATHALLLHNGHVFAGTQAGFFRSTNGGVSWIGDSAGLSNRPIRSLMVADQYLFAATYDGIWRRPLSQVTSVSEEQPEQSPGGLQFQGGRFVSFLLPSPAMIELELFEVSGKKAAVLLAGRLPAGTHNHRLDARIPDGLYVLRLRSGDRVQSRRVLLTQN